MKACWENILIQQIKITTFKNARIAYSTYKLKTWLEFVIYSRFFLTPQAVQSKSVKKSIM